MASDSTDRTTGNPIWVVPDSDRIRSLEQELAAATLRAEKAELYLGIVRKAQEKAVVLADDLKADRDRLRAEVERLRGIVEDAYREGWCDGPGVEGYVSEPLIVECWKKSDVRREAAQAAKG